MCETDTDWKQTDHPSVVAAVAYYGEKQSQLNIACSLTLKFEIILPFSVALLLAF